MAEIDREKVIEGLEFTKSMITFNPSTGEDIDPEALNEDNRITYDACIGAISLLKEQEPVKVKDCADIVDGIQVGYCPKCDRKIVWNPEKEETVTFCKYCGQEVKWDG